ncbi:hypothetical protein BHE74_00021212 [Ensete ventricosum]|nr:hypothetical protein GW17_00035217 [Ensete ventricosum]RWW71072.1 hypothetical protein BHE74_00021212 [Ensete ventricosum]RZR91013.1 hypothetical protein BHM03_00019047 [Ensete ventricosum]
MSSSLKGWSCHAGKSSVKKCNVQCHEELQRSGVDDHAWEHLFAAYNEDDECVLQELLRVEGHRLLYQEIWYDDGIVSTRLEGLELAVLQDVHGSNRDEAWTILKCLICRMRWCY